MNIVIIIINSIIVIISIVIVIIVIVIIIIIIVIIDIMVVIRGLPDLRGSQPQCRLARAVRRDDVLGRAPKRGGRGRREGKCS